MELHFRKSSFKTMELHFSSKLDWGSYIAKANPTKLEPWFVLWSLFLLRLLFVSVNQPYCLAWNVVMSRLVLLATMWICYTSYRKRYVEQLVLHLLPLLGPWLIVLIQSAYVFSLEITLADAHLNWLNWLPFLALVGDPLVIL